MKAVTILAFALALASCGPSGSSRTKPAPRDPQAAPAAKDDASKKDRTPAGTVGQGDASAPAPDTASASATFDGIALSLAADAVPDFAGLQAVCGDPKSDAGRQKVGTLVAVTASNALHVCLGPLDNAPRSLFLAPRPGADTYFGMVRVKDKDNPKLKATGGEGFILLVMSGQAGNLATRCFSTFDGLVAGSTTGAERGKTQSLCATGKALFTDAADMTHVAIDYARGLSIPMTLRKISP